MKQRLAAWGSEYYLMRDSTISLSGESIMGEDPIFSIGEWTVTPGKEALFLERWREFSRWSLNHINGGRWVYVVQDREQNNKFMSFGIWESPEDYTEWRHSTKFKSAFAEFSAMCDKVAYSTSTEVLHRYR